MRNAVDNPILNSPFHEPTRFWDFSGAAARVADGRRAAGYTGVARTDRGGDVAQAQQQVISLDLVNDIRERVRQWRAARFPNVTRTTRDLLEHWNHEERRPIFFCQREAAETIIWLHEASAADRQGIDVPKDVPIDPESLAAKYGPLTRYCTKMATGSGKTTVMAMLAAWQILNRLTNKTDGRFTDAILVVAPNLTVKDRLEVLVPQVPANYYERFDLVPNGYRELIQRGRVEVVNWQQFMIRDDDGRRGIVQRGRESDAAFVRRVLGKLRGAQQIVVMNDEAHHAWRPSAKVEDHDAQLQLTRDEKKEVEEEELEATVWVGGLDKINKVLGKGNQPGIKACIDLSATPFALKGSGRPEGEPLPWIVSDFSLVDAIESGITKIPRIPVRDDSGRPDPQYFRLWDSIVEKLGPAERGSGRAAPKPEAIWKGAAGALTMLAGKWKATKASFEEAGLPVPPTLIVVAANTDIAKEVADHILAGDVIDELTGDTTFQIDSKILKAAEAEDGSASKKVSEQLLRLKTATVGKAQWDGGAPPPSVANLPEDVRATLQTPPGKDVRCVVSVGMLTEGWDAQNVTQILGLRPFRSQLLCEQVVGRALRRMSYDVQEDGFLAPEYADVFGVPFEVIPVQGTGTAPPKPGQPSVLVQALPERQHLAIELPRVEGYLLDVSHGVRCDVDSIPTLAIEPTFETTATTVAPQLPVEGGRKLVGAGVGQETLTREEFYAQHRVQRTTFEIAAEIVRLLARGTDPAGQSLAWRPARDVASKLFPQIVDAVQRTVEERVTCVGTAGLEEIALPKYREKIVTRVLDALEPDEGAPVIQPRIERYRPIVSTGDVQFRTTKPVEIATRSHISHVVVDSNLERQAVFYLEREDLADVIVSYAKNDRLDFVIPYDVQVDGSEAKGRSYLPDWLVRVRTEDGGETIAILETKGWRNEDAKQKESAAHKWVRAVNAHGGLGRFEYRVIENASDIPAVLRKIAQPLRFERIEGLAPSVVEPDDERTTRTRGSVPPPAATAERQTWNDWVAATRTRAWMLRDPLLDWLDVHGAAKGFARDDSAPGFDARTDFTAFIFEKSRAFEQAVSKLLANHARIVRVAEAPEDSRDPKAVEATLVAMERGEEVIAQAVLGDPETRTYGAADFLVRSDVLARIFPDAFELDEGAWRASGRHEAIESFAATKLGGEWHYRVLDVKFTTLDLLKTGELGNDPSSLAYKAQLYVYNRALGRMQGFQPPSSFLLGRGWKDASGRGSSCMERVAWVPQDARIGKERTLASEVEAAVRWVRDVRELGRDWNVSPLPTRDELRPNMKNTSDAPWHGAKRKLADELRELTKLWQVGIERREQAFAATPPVRTWDDPRLTAEIVGVNGPKTRPVLESMLAVNRDATGPAVRPGKVTANENEWRAADPLEFFVDFETVSDLDDDFSRLPDKGGQPLVFMVGCGHVEAGRWTFRCFTADGLDAASERAVLDAWFSHMTEVQRVRGLTAPPRVFHWSPAEVSNLETAYNSARARHPDASWPVPRWFDFLNRVVKVEPIVVRGAFGFGLKAIGKALKAQGLIETSWADGPTDGLGAMVAAWSAATEATGRGVKLRDVPLMQEVERYNEVDCKVMREVIEYVRARH